MGNTLGTEVTASWDPAVLGEVAQVWAEHGYIHDNGPGAMTVDSGGSHGAERARGSGRRPVRARGAAAGQHDGVTGRLRVGPTALEDGVSRRAGTPRPSGSRRPGRWCSGSGHQSSGA